MFTSLCGARIDSALMIQSDCCEKAAQKSFRHTDLEKYTVRLLLKRLYNTLWIAGETSLVQVCVYALCTCSHHSLIVTT